MITARIGNLFESNARTFVNTVNCVGVMGKGVALEFKKRFPAMFRDYQERCQRGEVKLGQPYVYKDLYGPQIINFPTKDHWRSASKLADIAAGLDYLAAHASEWDLSTVAMPPLGCGNGGLDWTDVGPLIYEKLKHLPIDVEVYAPFGTPSSQLTEEFLASGGSKTPRLKGRTQRPLGEGLIVLLETLRLISIQPHAQPIGRTKFQKVAYALTFAGVPTGFNFAKGSYGPFSKEARDSVGVLANANLLEEEARGRMMMMSPTIQYEDSLPRYSAVIERYQEAIDRTTDLFSRIHTSEQAELIATALYAYEHLSRGRSEPVQIDEVTEYVGRWKKRWASDSAKLADVKDAIVALGLLGWAPHLELRDDLDLFAEFAEPAALA